ncbi:hypothetical protein NBRC116592_34510 [Colwellia sp. KU-HH00111]|uniref:hypothetical protein n=1 Tax=Colwellia sp. KU-HH00111 TaxID=3127652 RepID=UPI00310676FA
MTAHNSIEIVEKIYKLSKKRHIKDVDNYIQSILAELLKEQTSDDALTALSKIEFRSDIREERRFKITKPDFKLLVESLKEEKNFDGYLLKASIELINKLVQLGGDYLTQLKLHDKESSVRKVYNALQDLCEMDKDTFIKILHSWIAHCHLYFAEGELKIDENFVTKKHKELFGYDLKVEKRIGSLAHKTFLLWNNQCSKKCTKKLSIDPLSGDDIRAIKDIFDGIIEEIEDSLYKKERFFYSQLNKLVDRYNITVEDIAGLREIKEKSDYSDKIFKDKNGEGRIPNFILGYHQLKKQKSFLDEWAANSSLLENEIVNLTGKVKSLLDKYSSQIDIYDTGFALHNNELPTLPTVIKSILMPDETELTKTFKPYGKNRRSNNSDELFKPQELRYSGKITMISDNIRRMNPEHRFWFELSLAEYLNKHPTIEQSFTNVFNYIFKSSADIYHDYWLAFLKALRDRSFVNEPPQHLVLMDEVLKESFDSYFDSWVNSNGSYKSVITESQLPEDKNPFVIKPKQNNKWNNEKVLTC